MPDHMPAFVGRCGLSHITADTDDPKKRVHRKVAVLCTQTAPANNEAAYTAHYWYKLFTNLLKVNSKVVLVAFKGGFDLLAFLATNCLMYGSYTSCTRS